MVITAMTFIAALSILAEAAKSRLASVSFWVMRLNI